MEFCRLCDLKTKPDSYEHIFNKTNDPPIWKMIADLANLTILESDPYTKIVCFQCFDQLQKFYVFRKKVLYTDWRIRHIRNKNIDKDTERDSQTVKTEIEQEIINIEEHILKIENETDKDHQNISKDKDMFDKPSGDHHMVIIDDSDETITVDEPKNRSDTTGNKTITVGESKNCSDRTENKTPNNGETTTVDGSSLNESSNNETNKNHNETSDKSINPDESSTHTETLKSKKRYQCDKCKKMLTGKNSLRSHLKIHTGLRRYYPCIICGYKFTSQRILDRHLKSGNYEHQCEVCNEKFPARCVYRLHLKKHFLQSLIDDNDDDNKKTQQTNKRYKCTICSKTFTYHSRLVRHFRTHSGSRPYKCNICGRGYPANKGLKIHLLVHSGEKPHQCDKCGQTFALLDNLKSHIKRVHTKLHECTICNKIFINERRLRSHAKEHLTK